jgi:hypothetical protein
VAQAIGSLPAPLAVDAQPFFLQNSLEEFALPLGEDQVGWSGRSPWLGRRRVIGPVRRGGGAMGPLSHAPFRTGHFIAFYFLSPPGRISLTRCSATSSCGLWNVREGCIK